MQFVKDQAYTRPFIHSQLHGEMVTFLTQYEGRIVCACLDPDTNPDAPNIVLVGGPTDGSEDAVTKKARLLAKQMEPIPVFLKRDSSEWVYNGLYRCSELIEDRNWLEQRAIQAGRSDIALAIILESAEPLLATYLLTWNPNNWQWKNLEQQVRQTAEGRPIESRWSCGNTKRIIPGDRMFLLRQGKEPRGIMAAGWATSEPYEGPHWNEEKKKIGDTANFVMARFDRILNPEVDEILELSNLQIGPLKSVNWNTPASGIEIKEGAAALERLWSELLHLYRPVEDTSGELGAIEGELRISLSRHRAREAWLRQKKIEQAKKLSNGTLPCEICHFDFLSTYGTLGQDYAQVHHIKPLSDLTKPSQTVLSDLAVVCANCHVMIHRGGVTRSLEDVKQTVKAGQQ